jgi:hypothetical protein
MATWTDEDLAALHAAESLRLAAAPAGEQPDGTVEIGVVTISDAAYVRAYRGTRSAWFQATQTFRHGTIRTGSLKREVCFEPADPALADKIDAAYHSKYGHYGAAAVGFAVSAASRAGTVKITPARS